MTTEAMATSENWIVTDPAVLGGRPHIRGTQITVADIIGRLSVGVSKEEILRDEPELTREAVEEVVRYTGRLSH